ncbi:hypothetical protein PHAVU_005G110000 [Phaseolus vulgaris]|uniref:Uncharacterized protein n=1 Tax=Phaseolus vulgaris TaxID=3885 RepID=V7BV80_PHAVU|nr:hypothetical protein PHAVU_005G110000g [Phaseolus vulgaris]ESW21912.1 hypothetical protein PHAVU_005G110000g [Phaseolus vulgaris]
MMGSSVSLSLRHCSLPVCSFFCSSLLLFWSSFCFSSPLQLSLRRHPHCPVPPPSPADCLLSPFIFSSLYVIIFLNFFVVLHFSSKVPSPPLFHHVQFLKWSEVFLYS